MPTTRFRTCPHCGYTAPKGRAGRPRVDPLTHWTEREQGYATPCWEWRGYVNANGFGQVGSKRTAHRAVYAGLRGAIPHAHLLWNLCGSKSCVRPDHWEPVNRAEYLERQRRGRRLA